MLRRRRMTERGGSRGPVVSGITFPNANLKYRNTYYFDRKAMQGAFDWNKAWVYHWLHDDTAAPVLTSGILESLKPPLESRIWFAYPGQPSSLTYSSGITVRKPTIIARVVDGAGGTTSNQVHKHWCHETKGVNPLHRVFGVAREAMVRSKKPGFADDSWNEKTP